MTWYNTMPSNQGCGVGVGFFCPTPDVQLDYFSHYTHKLGISLEMVQFLLKFLLKQIFCCAPRFWLILIAKRHSLYVKESESEILERSVSELEWDILLPTTQPCFKLRLYFSFSLLHFIYIPNDGFWLSWNVEKRNAFDYLWLYCSQYNITYLNTYTFSYSSFSKPESVVRRCS